jgi:hypothetical protein
VVSGVLGGGGGVAECGPGGEVEELSLVADGVGSFAEHGVVEESVSGFGVVAACVEAVVVWVAGWDGAQVNRPG